MKLFVLFYGLIFSSCFVHADQQKLTVEKAIQLAAKNSYEMKNIYFDEELVDLDYRTALRNIILPRVSINGNISNSKNIYKIERDDLEEFGSEEDEMLWQKSSELALNIEGINLINSGLDYISYKITKIAKLNGDMSIKNQKKIFLMTIYKEYFSLKAMQERVNAATNRVQILKSFLDTIKATGLNENNEEDYYAMKSEYSDALQQRISLIRDYKFQNYQFNLLLNEPLTKKFNLVSDFPEVNTKIDSSRIDYLMSSSIELKEATRNLEVAKLNKTITNISFLPNLSVNLTGFNYGGSWDNLGTFTRIKDSDGSQFFNLSAALTLTVPLWSEQGLFGMDDRRRASIDVMRSRYEKERLKKDLQIRIASTSISLSTIEKTIEENEKVIENKGKLLDVQLKKYQKGKINNLQIRETLDSLTESILSLYDNKLQQIDIVIELSSAFEHDNPITKTVQASLNNFGKKQK